LPPKDFDQSGLTAENSFCGLGQMARPSPNDGSKPERASATAAAGRPAVAADASGSLPPKDGSDDSASRPYQLPLKGRPTKQ